MKPTMDKLTSQPATKGGMSEGEVLLRQVLGSAQDAIFAIDRDYRLLFSNEFHKQALIASGSHPIGIGESVLSPDYLRHVLDFWRRAYDRALADEIFRMETPWTDTTGNEHIFENNFSPLRDARGEIIGVLIVAHDITTHKQAELELKYSQQRFSTLFRSNPVPMGITDAADLRIVDVNDAWSELTGFARAEALGRTSAELGLARPEALQSIRTKIEEQGGIRQYEIPLSTRTGKERKILLTSDPIILEGKAYFLSNLLDITGRKQDEETLQVALAKYRTLFENFPLGITISDSKGNILETNQIAEALLGISREEQVRRQLDGAEWQIIRPDGTPMPAEEFPSLRALREGQKVSDVEMGIVKPDHSVSWLNVTAAPIELDRYGVVVTYSDITERKRFELAFQESEEKFRVVFENSRDGINLLDLRTGRYILMNPAQVALTGFTDQEINNMSAEEAYDRVHPDDRQISVEHQNLVITGDGRGKTVEYRWKVKSGEYRWFSDSRSVVRDDKGNTIALVGISRDITERKEIESRLKSEREKLDRIASSMPGVICSFHQDVSGKTSMPYASPAVRDLFGLDPADIASDMTPVFSRMLPEDVGHIIASIEQSARTMGIWQDEYRYRHPEKGLIWIEGFSSPVKEADGSITWHGFVADITNRKRNEQLMRQWADAFEHCAHGIAIGLPDTNKILTCNQAFSRLQGRTTEEISSMPIIEMYAPEDHGHVKEQIMEADRKGSVRYEAQMVRKDGSRYPVQMDVVSVRDSDGNILYRVATQQDISQRMQSKEQSARLAERLDLATHAGQIGIWDWDIQKDQLVWDTQMYSLYGLKPGEFGGAYQAWLNGVHPDDRETGHEKSMRAVRGEGEYDSEFRVVWPDNTVHWLKAEGQVFRDACGTPLRMVGVNYDITKRKHAEMDLIKAKERAEESDRLKSHFLTNISHEIRTPMNGILGFTDLLRTMDPTGEQREKFFDIIQASGERLMITINDLIEVANLQAGAVSVTIKEVNINEMLRFHYDLFDLQARQKGLQLYVITPLPDVKALVMTDRSKLDSILINLIRNSIKFTRKGVVEFGYKIKEKEIEFHVNDTGAGIPADRLDAIFERFVQADLKLSRAHEGSGLGLSIAKGYVEMLGGRIWVESKEGAGSTFRFTIPWNPVEISEVAGEPVQTGMQPDFLREHTILVVEDDIENSIYMETILNSLCKSVVLSGNGPEAIRLCSQHNSISIVLMDIKMPGMDGYETTRQIRQFNPDLLIIAQTAYSSPAERDTALQAGCNDFITKPFSLNELEAILSKNIK